MRLISNEAFLTWAAENGIGLTQAETQVLTFIPPRGDSRFWETPLGADNNLSLLTLMLDALDDWESLWAYKRLGAWTFQQADRAAFAEPTMDAAHRWTGIPIDYAGSVRFDKTDRAQLILLIAMIDKFGADAASDLFLVPDHGRQILWLNHHYAIFIFFADPSKIAPFVDKMASFGFGLPTDPDEDFHWGRWLGETPDGWKYVWEE